MPASKKQSADGKGFWQCNGCYGESCGYLVPRGIRTCGVCTNHPPLHVSDERKAAPGQGGGSKGAGKGGASAGAKGKGKGKGGEKGWSSGGSGQNESRKDKENRELKDRVKALEAEAKKGKAKVGDAPPVEAGAGSANPTTCDPAMGEAVAKAKDELKKLNAIPQDTRDILGDFAERLATAKAKLNAAQEAQRAACPLDQRLKAVQLAVKQASEKAEQAGRAVDSKEAEAEKANKALADAKGAKEERDAALQKAKEELDVVTREYAREIGATCGERPGTEDAGAAHGPDLAAFMAEAKAFAAEAMAAGHCFGEYFIRRDVANQKWDEAMAHLRQAAPGDDGRSDAGASEAGDLDIDLDVVNDDDWAKMDKLAPKKRCAIIQRAAAKSARASLGKVSAAASPFQKKRG
jgi:hypothetical protein